MGPPQQKAPAPDDQGPNTPNPAGNQTSPKALICPGESPHEPESARLHNLGPTTHHRNQSSGRPLPLKGGPTWDKHPQRSMLMHNRTREPIQSQSHKPICNTLTHVPAHPRQDHILLWWLQRSVPDKLFLPHCRKRSSTTKTSATEFCVLQPSAPSRDAGVFRASGSGAALFSKMLDGIETDTFCLYLERRIPLSFSLFWWIWTLSLWRWVVVDLRRLCLASTLGMLGKPCPQTVGVSWFSPLFQSSLSFIEPLIVSW